jgi:glycosyltransferase involved in cell wall biosynthesis
VNILHVTPYYAPAWAYGGVVRAVSGLARAQARAGHTVVVLTTDALDGRHRSRAGAETVDGVRVIRVRNRSNRLRRALNVSTPVGLEQTARRLVADHAIQLVHCHEVRALEALAVARMADRSVAVVVSPHGTLSLETGRGFAKRCWDRAFARRLLPRFDQVVALTADEAREVHALWRRWRVPLEPHRVAIVPNGVDPDEFARRPSSQAFRERWALGDGPIVFFAGRLVERKGLAILAEAFEVVNRDVPGARLLVVGPDGGAGSGALERAGRARDRVVLTGLLAGDDRLAAYSAASLLALPAVGEGLSMAVLEAMACGLPVLLTPGCHFPEVEAAGAGLIVGREVTPLAEGLRILLVDGALRARMGACARELVSREYAWPHIVRRLDAVYGGVLARARFPA